MSWLGKFGVLQIWSPNPPHVAAPGDVMLLSSACHRRGWGALAGCVLRASEEAPTRRRKEKVLCWPRDGSLHRAAARSHPCSLSPSAPAPQHPAPSQLKKIRHLLCSFCHFKSAATQAGICRERWREVLGLSPLQSWCAPGSAGAAPCAGGWRPGGAAEPSKPLAPS